MAELNPTLQKIIDRDAAVRRARLAEQQRLQAQAEAPFYQQLPAYLTELGTQAYDYGVDIANDLRRYFTTVDPRSIAGQLENRDKNIQQVVTDAGKGTVTPVRLK